MSLRMVASFREIKYFIKNTIPIVRATAPTAAPTFDFDQTKAHKPAKTKPAIPTIAPVESCSDWLVCPGCVV